MVKLSKHLLQATETSNEQKKVSQNEIFLYFFFLRIKFYNSFIYKINKYC